MGKCICPSEFDVPLQVMQPVTNANLSGGQTVEFQHWFDAWAKVELGARSERFREQKIQGVKFYTLTMHYDSRVDDKTAVTIDEQLWNVRSVDGVDGRKEYMLVVVELGAGA